MDTIQAIMTRRSVRQFTSRAVERETVETLLRSAMQAPSARNEQPWEFVVIDDRQLLDQIPTFHPYAAMAHTSPVAILVCGDLHRELSKGLWIQDCAAAVENLLLAAHAQGLGAVWCACYPYEDRSVGFRTMLGLPDHIVPFAIVPVGYPAHEPPAQNRYEAARIKWNAWSK
jgi:nitroreductase